MPGDPVIALLRPHISNLGPFKKREEVLPRFRQPWACSYLLAADPESFEYHSNTFERTCYHAYRYRGHKGSVTV